jgi:hypothetical protein
MAASIGQTSCPLVMEDAVNGSYRIFQLVTSKKNLYSAWRLISHSVLKQK